MVFIGYQTAEWKKIRVLILQRDKKICQICGEGGDTVDHIIPWRMGGDDSLSNLRVLCRSCNSKKEKNKWCGYNIAQNAKVFIGIK